MISIKTLKTTFFAGFFTLIGFVLSTFIQPLGRGKTIHSVVMQSNMIKSGAIDDICCSANNAEYLSQLISDSDLEWAHVYFWGDGHIGIEFYEFRPWRLKKRLDEKMRIAETLLNKCRMDKEKE